MCSPSQRTRWIAALLAAGSGSVLSHLSSAQAADLARERGPVPRPPRDRCAHRVARRPLPVAGANAGLERGFQRFTAEYGFPSPHCNVLVGGLLVDFWWPQAELVVELDSREFHSHWSAAERDRERNAKLLRLDIHTLRVTGRRLHRDRDGLAADIEARFANAGADLHRSA